MKIYQFLCRKCNFKNFASDLILRLHAIPLKGQKFAKTRNLTKIHPNKVGETFRQKPENWENFSEKIEYQENFSQKIENMLEK